MSAREHWSRYKTGVGWHTFAHPTEAQILDRMRRRRAERAEWHRANGYNAHRYRVVGPDHQDPGDPFTPGTVPPETRATPITDDEVLDSVTTDRWLRWEWLRPENWPDELFDAPFYAEVA
ncbi:hypothetical protein HNR23_002294 [Nocardiopsis mwathae]|uniref:Uncharacterized protein n=1 Tax=Nocardiopsis mwathae TaxID=1472723 RepID=A0A7X0D6L0_9ACTN|nr:hypothetical protein [Nocardiopsis mwathae]MBB6172234.1 hypothetical protein [Nocardiopsis mwathae]